MQLGCVQLHATAETLLSIAVANQGAEIPIFNKTKVILLYAALKENIFFLEKGCQEALPLAKIPKIRKLCKDMIKTLQYLRS